MSADPTPDEADALVVCVDGPYEGMWFTWSDWRQRVRAARRMVALDQPRGVCLDYRRNGATIAHPKDENRFGVGLAFLTGTD